MKRPYVALQLCVFWFTFNSHCCLCVIQTFNTSALTAVRARTLHSVKSSNTGDTRSVNKTTRHRKSVSNPGLQEEEMWLTVSSHDVYQRKDLTATVTFYISGTSLKLKSLFVACGAVVVHVDRSSIPHLPRFYFKVLSKSNVSGPTSHPTQLSPILST